MVKGWSVFGWLILSGCAAVMLGCRQTAPPASEQRPIEVRVSTQQEQSASDPAARTEQIETAIHSDPCSLRLQQISGAILEYIAIHARLPEKLSQLNALPDLDEPLTFTCPGSAHPFVYVPSGLVSPTDPRQIVVYDPDTDRAGLRWVICLRRPRPREAAATFVERMPQAVFQTFTPAVR